jgi:2-polyprenyl-3-methyl-5-hydroxy-6-metoxy-1,4-benzoquinol methylase
MKEKISLINNRDILFSKSLLVFNIFAMFIYLICFGFSIYFFNNTENYLSLTQRNHYIYFSFIPLISFNYTFWAYENLYPNRQFNNSTIIKLLVFIMYLSIPSIILIFRYKIDLSQIKSLHKTLGLLLFVIGPFLAYIKLKINIIDTILDICFRPWSNNLESLKSKYFSKKVIESQRVTHYLNKENLDIFQNSFIESTVEDIKIINHIKSTEFLKGKRDLSVLDIGGHNGIFTEKILHGIDRKISSIDMVDPVHNKYYEDNLKAICTKINVTNLAFEEYTTLTEKKFDLILASHSLYNYLDNKKNQALIINKIKSFLKPNGLAIIVLGSKNSPAYSLKSSIIEFMLNEKNSDSNADGLTESIQLEKELKYSILNIDNFINMNEILNDSNKLCNWISYFTRTPKITNDYDLVQIKKMIYYYSIEGKHIPDLCNQARNNDSEYLLHKTKAILISTVANNVYKK